MQSDFTNPITDVAYRLITSGSSWRITRSQTKADGHLRLAHLRGTVGDADLPDADAALLVRGRSHRVLGEVEPGRAFAAVVLCDLTATADYLVAVAREAAEVYQHGRPGFRPRSAALRELRDQAVIEAAGGCREMAAAWQNSGLVGELPKLLVAAMAEKPG